MKIMMYADGEMGMKKDEIIFRGTEDEVRMAARIMGVADSEFYLGVFELSPNENNVAHYGVGGRFLYSERVL